MTRSDPPSPIPKRYHRCEHKDIQVLLDDVRQTRKHRWWLVTTIVVLALGSLSGMAFWIYSVGERVGGASTRMEYMRSASENDREIIGKNTDAIRGMERENSQRYSEIQQVLIRIDGRLENLERSIRSKSSGSIRR